MSSLPRTTTGKLKPQFVGPYHIVEIINGNFEIFDKTTGASLDNRSLDSFWVNTVGLSQAGIQGFTFDPRIVFDPDSGVWFAVSIDSSDTNNDGVRDSGNQIYVARTDTDDPEGDWDGVRFAADTVGGQEFHEVIGYGKDHLAALDNFRAYAGSNYHHR